MRVNLLERNAVLSDCGKYRYSLSRKWGAGDKIYGFIGVNPSTADAETEDATTRRWRGFVERWGGDGYITVNLFALRATNVKELASASEPVGADNDSFIQNLGETVGVIVPCWGSIKKIPLRLHYRVEDVVNILAGLDCQFYHFGMTSCGHPKHPLMLPYETKLQEF